MREFIWCHISTVDSLLARYYSSFLGQFSVCFHLLHRRRQILISRTSFVLSTVMMSLAKKETIKIVFPAPMNEKWKWWNCFFKEPLCQLTNFHFLDSGEVEFWNLKAQSDWIYIYFCFYLYPAFKNKKNVGYRARRIEKYETTKPQWMCSTSRRISIFYMYNISLYMRSCLIRQ